MMDGGFNLYFIIINKVKNRVLVRTDFFIILNNRGKSKSKTLIHVHLISVTHKLARTRNLYINHYNIFFFIGLLRLC